MHGSTIDVNQMQPHGKKRRMDWESLDLNDSGSGSSGIGVVESKMPNLGNNGKECERSRTKSVNGGMSSPHVYSFYFCFCIKISVKFSVIFGILKVIPFAHEEKISRALEENAIKLQLT